MVVRPEELRVAKQDPPKLTPGTLTPVVLRPEVPRPGVPRPVDIGPGGSGDVGECDHWYGGAGGNSEFNFGVVFLSTHRGWVDYSGKPSGDLILEAPPLKSMYSFLNG